MKFDIAILNPPYNQHSLHIKHIKRMKLFSNKIVVIIPARDGNMEIMKFDNIYHGNYLRLKIYSFNTDKKLLIEKYTKFPQSKFYISVPKWVCGLKKYFDTGEYEDNKNYYYTFSFHTKNDLKIFKDRLCKIKLRGSICPEYWKILQGINYIKAYKEI